MHKEIDYKEHIAIGRQCAFIWRVDFAASHLSDRTVRSEGISTHRRLLQTFTEPGRSIHEHAACVKV